MFLIFAGNTYYPLGGWSDYVSLTHSIEAAKRVIAHMGGIDWWQIVSWPDGEIVDHGIRF